MTLERPMMSMAFCLLGCSSSILFTIYRVNSASNIGIDRRSYGGCVRQRLALMHLEAFSLLFTSVDKGGQARQPRLTDRSNEASCCCYATAAGNEPCQGTVSDAYRIICCVLVDRIESGG